ncbi:hypothetical protein STEG23_002052, partial [Scotinomys teguina]
MKTRCRSYRQAVTQGRQMPCKVSVYGEELVRPKNNLYHKQGAFSPTESGGPGPNSTGQEILQ